MKARINTMKSRSASAYLILAGSVAAMLAGQSAQAATFTWSKLINATAASANWSTGTSWSGVPASAADTTLVFAPTYGINTQTETNNLTNDVANPFLLNVLTLGVNASTAGNGAGIATFNINGSPLSFVLNGATTPVFNLNANRSNGQGVVYNVQSDVVLDANTLFTGNGTATFTVSGATSGNGSFTKSGSSALTLSGANSFMGGLVMNGGTLTLSNAGNSYTGGTTISGGTLSIGTAAHLGNASSALVFDGGTLQITGTAITSFVGTGNVGRTVSLTSGKTVGLDINNASNTFIADQVLNQGAGGLTKAGAGILQLSQTNTYTGSTAINAGTLSITGSGSLGSGTYAGAIANAGTLIFSSSADQTLSGTISGSGSLTKNTNTSTLTLSAANTFSGLTTVTVGTLTLTNALALQNSALFTTTGTSTLSGITGGLTIGGLSGSRDLGSADVLSGYTDNISALTLNTAAAGPFTYSGVISNGTGSMSLTKTGTGTQVLTGINTYSGATNLNAGTLTLSGTGSILLSSITLNGGGLNLTNTAPETGAGRVNDTSVITSNGGGISYANTSGANTYTETLGAVTLNGGNLDVVQTTNQAGAGSQTLTFGTIGSSNLTQSGAGSVAFSALTTGPQASGNKNMIVVFGAGSTSGWATGAASNPIIGPWATTGTAAAAQTDYAVYSGDHVVPAATVASAESTWTSATAQYTAGLLGTAGTTLGATRNITALKLVATTSALTSVTFAGAAATDFITVTGSTFANGDVVSFGGTAPGGLVTGFPYYVVNAGNNGAGTFTVSATSGGAPIELTSAGTGPNVIAGITLGSGINLGTTGILNTTGAGLTIGKGTGGVVTLPSSTSANLYVSAGNGAAVIVGAPIADNGAGVLTLVKTGTAALRLFDVNTHTGNTFINAGTLQIGLNGIINGAKLGGSSGIYAGNIFIGAGASLDFQTNADQTLSGIISGDGSLLKRYIGTLTLSGANTYTGKTTIGAITNAGDPTLVVSSFNSVVGGTASSSLGAPTTVANGTIEVGSSNSTPNPTLRYGGVAATGETTDRVIHFIFNSGATRTLDASNPSGLLKFTSAFTSNGTATGSLVLTGSGNGEIAQGLLFAFTNLTKNGNGTWTLGGAVGSTGLLTVNAGTLALQKTTSLHGGSAANWTSAKVNVKSGATLALNVDSAGAAGFSASDLNTLLTNISVAGSAAAGLQSGARIGIDTSTATGGTFTQGNVIANSTGANGGPVGLTKLGTGTLVLDETNTYTGATTVNAGTLLVEVGGSISGSSAVAVNSGGTLGGAGIVGGNITVANGGKLSPGASPGTLTVGGNINLSAVNTASSLIFELGTTSDQITLTIGTLSIGTGTLGFSDFAFSNSGGLAAGEYTLFDSTTDIIGSLDAGDLTGTIGAFSATLGFGDTDNDIVLTVVPEPSSVALLGLGVFGLMRRRRRVS